VASSLSGTLEFQVTKKLFDGIYELFSGFFELGALVFCFSLIFWVSGLFLGLAVCSVRSHTLLILGMPPAEAFLARPSATFRVQGSEGSSRMPTGHIAVIVSAVR